MKNGNLTNHQLELLKLMLDFINRKDLAVLEDNVITIGKFKIVKKWYYVLLKDDKKIASKAKFYDLAKIVVEKIIKISFENHLDYLDWNEIPIDYEGISAKLNKIDKVNTISLLAECDEIIVNKKYFIRKAKNLYDLSIFDAEDEGEYYLTEDSTTLSKVLKILKEDLND